jgi:hypothetical protein
VPGALGLGADDEAPLGPVVAAQREGVGVTDRGRLDGDQDSADPALALAADRERQERRREPASQPAQTSRSIPSRSSAAVSPPSSLSAILLSRSTRKTHGSLGSRHSLTARLLVWV